MADRDRSFRGEQRSDDARCERSWRRDASGTWHAYAYCSDLIERVRYPNPLPELPYPPKLIQVPAPEPNYTSPAFALRMTDSLQLPVTVDAEAGMPLDLAKMEHLWLGDGSQRAYA